MPDNRKIVIIGGGIAGLCAAAYAQKSGYQTEVCEMNETPGGLATSWRRGDYIFETCLHWLLGSNPNSAMYSQWKEVFDIGRLTFVHPKEYATIQTEHGERLSIYTNPDRMETELLKRAPEDAAAIHHFASAVRKFARIALPDPAERWPLNWVSRLRMLPNVPMLRWWSKRTIGEYGNRFRNPLLRAFFQSGEPAQLSAIALVFSLAWMSDFNAGYPIGGSQAVIRLIVENFLAMGGRIRFGAKVAEIVVKGGAATGVRLAGGEIIPADWVVSAADGYTTVYKLLGGKFADKITDRTCRNLRTFHSYLQVSLGVTRDLSQQPGYLTLLLDAPLTVDPGTQLSRLAFRFFHFDPTFAPPGKTAVTCFLPTRNFDFWVNLQRNNPAEYQAEKDRIAEAVIAVLETSVPGVRQAIEVIDVSTPATVIRHTGNWKGSMEGWLLTPGSGYRPLRMTLPGLRQFLMVGQWVMPGGGLPSGLMTARSAIQTVYKQDRVPFLAPHTVIAGPLQKAA
jgi:phytoene dehydrogenase-like protein